MTKQYTYKSAFKVVKYTNNFGQSVYIWNSRDGCPDCHVCLHIGDHDLYSETNSDSEPPQPDYIPPVGSLMFVDYTPELAMEEALEYCTSMAGEHPEHSKDKIEQNKNKSVRDFAEDFIIMTSERMPGSGPNHACLVKVTAEMNAFIKQLRTHK